MSSAFNVNAEDFSATQILAIPLDEPERIFSKDLTAIQKAKKKLSMKWHPDHSSDPMAADVLQHILELAVKAQRKVELGTWKTPGMVEIDARSGNGVRFKYLKKHVFELGEFYITSRKVIYVVRPEFGDLFDNAVDTIQNLKFANDSMKKGFDVYFPKIVRHFEAKSGDRILIVEKQKDAVLLRDYFNHVSGNVELPHVAWIMSRLHNFTSYLQWAGLTHNGLSLDTCFIIGKDTEHKRDKSNPIAPKDHTVTVMGGWWYAAKAGAALKGLPSNVTDYVPRDALKDGITDFKIDRTLIRLIGRELLGDKSGVRLLHNSHVPRPMADWLTLPGSGNAIDDFVTWREKILIDSFGPRKFVEMAVGPNDIYQPQP